MSADNGLDSIDPDGAQSPEEITSGDDILDIIAPRATTSDIPTPPRGISYYRNRILNLKSIMLGKWPKYKANPPVDILKFFLIVEDLDAIQNPDADPPLDEPKMIRIYTSNRRPMARLQKVYEMIRKGQILVKNPKEDLQNPGAVFDLKGPLRIAFWKGKSDGSMDKTDPVHLLSPKDLKTLRDRNAVPSLDATRVPWEREEVPDDDLST